MVNHTRYEHQYTVVNHTRNEHQYTVVNHTRNKHHYTVVIITWLIILGMNTIIQWL